MDPENSSAARSLLDREGDHEYTQYWTKKLSGLHHEDPGPQTLHFIFRVGTAWVALPTKTFVEVHSALPVRSLPFRSNSVFWGIASTKGSILLVVGIEHLLGLEARPPSLHVDKSEKMLEVLCKNDRFLVRASEVFGNVPIRERDLTPACENEYVTHTLEVEGLSVHILSTSAVFDAWTRFIK